MAVPRACARQDSSHCYQLPVPDSLAVRESVPASVSATGLGRRQFTAEDVEVVLDVANFVTGYVASLPAQVVAADSKALQEISQGIVHDCLKSTCLTLSPISMLGCYAGLLEAFLGGRLTGRNFASRHCHKLFNIEIGGKGAGALTTVLHVNVISD